MARLQLRELVPLLLVAVAVVFGVAPRGASALTRHDCPEGFVFGAGSSAFQVEGAAAEDGRKPSIWDTFTHAGYSYDGSTADVSADQYHHYKEDVKLMHEMGLDAYRFSIAWRRLIPDGRGEINPKGLEYYNNLIDELILHGIEPHATIYHIDLPQVLQDEYGGLLSPRFIEDYTAYADVCFKHFGDRVKHWVTVNEPNIETIGGFDMGSEPPRRCSYPFGENCTGGNSSTEPYIAAHHLLLAHASAVSLYRDKYKGHVESPPWALGKLLDHLKLNYENPLVMIHENGYGDAPDTPSAIEYDDEDRSEFLQDYLEVLDLSIRNGSNARGYFVWSFLDVFEFLYGYRVRFGLCGVDMNAAVRTRYVRSSARWYSGFLDGGEFQPPAHPEII